MIVPVLTVISAMQIMRTHPSPVPSLCRILHKDGFGEGFEQRPIETDEGDMYVSFWNSGDDYFIRTKEEMDEALGQGMKMEGM